MQIEVVSDEIRVVEADSLLVGVWAGGALSEELAALSELAAPALADWGGKPGDEVLTLYPQGALPARRVLLVGLGEPAAFTLDTLRRAAGKGIARAQRSGGTVATTLHRVAGDFSAAEAARAVAEGARLAHYRYTLKPQAEGEAPKEVERLLLVGGAEEAEAAAAQGAAIAAGVAQARDLVNAPPNIANAPYLAQLARQLAEQSPHIRATILSLEEARALGMGAFAGVAQGSAVAPQFIVLEYRVEELAEQRPFGVVGKGLIFDTGGISIKPSTDLWKMKSDMAGGAAVLGLFRALAALPEPLPVPVVGVVPATDNAVGHLSFTPADVLTALNGKTIEIQNTDAEGRLILADALTYVDRYKPRAVVDLATLTGGVVIALGYGITGLFSNDDALAAQLQQASERSSEPLWRLPLPEEYEKLIESDIATVKNTGGRAASSITAALFLQHFIGDYPWAHLDIAGTAWGNEAKPYAPKGASGVGVRLLMEWLLAQAQ